MQLGEISYLERKSFMRHIHNPKALRAAFEHPAFREWFGERFHNEARMILFQTGETLIEQGESSHALILLLEGRVSISAIMPNGKRRILKIESAPALLGELELLEMTPPTMTVRALEGCRTVLLPFSPCRNLLLSDPLFLQHLGILLCHKERQGVQRLFHTFSYPLENRLARFILEMKENNCFLVRKVTAADSLGVSYRHLSDVLGDFVRKGYLRKEGLSYSIVNDKALKSLAEQMDS